MHAELSCLILWWPFSMCGGSGRLAHVRQVLQPGRIHQLVPRQHFALMLSAQQGRAHLVLGCCPANACHIKVWEQTFPADIHSETAS